MVELELEEGEVIQAERGAMVAMSPTIDVDGTIQDGLFSSIGRMFAGEKLFSQKLRATRGNGKVFLAPPSIGDIVEIDLDGTYSLALQKDGYLAATEDVRIDTRVQNLAKGLFSKEGFFILNITGKGRMFINSLGAIHTVTLAQGEEYIIDNGHLVAWDSAMNYKIEKSSSGWISSITSGECLVCRFTGPGVVMIQSRNPNGFGDWLKDRVILPTDKAASKSAGVLDILDILN